MKSLKKQQKGLKKQEIEENIQQGVNVIKEYMDIEQGTILKLNSERINEINKLIDKKKYLEAPPNLAKLFLCYYNIIHNEAYIAI